jgi:hypothetical protein
VSEETIVTDDARMFWMFGAHDSRPDVLQFDVNIEPIRRFIES